MKVDRAQRQVLEVNDRVDRISEGIAALSGRVVDFTSERSDPALEELLGELTMAVRALGARTEEVNTLSEALEQTREQLDAQAARYLDLFELAPDGYLVTDANGVILESNRAASGLLGSPARFLYRKPVIVFVDAEQRRLVLDCLNEALTVSANSVVGFEAGFAPPNGRPFPASVHLTASRSYGSDAVHVRWLIRDVSEREASRRAMQEALGLERRASAALREADATKDALILAASHDLNTPVAAVAALAQLLLGHPGLPPAEIAHIAGGLVTTSGQLRGILSNLLDAERLGGGHVVVKSEPTDLTEIVVTRARDLGFDEGRLTLPDEAVMADLDFGLTARIVDNLLGNAVNHSPVQASVQVRIEASLRQRRAHGGGHWSRCARRDERGGLSGLPARPRPRRRRPRPGPLHRATLRRDPGGSRLGRGHTRWRRNVQGLVSPRVGRRTARLKRRCGRAQPGFGSFGSPSARSPTMLRWISAAPPQMVSERETKNRDWMLSTG